ncbi:MAG: permease [Campylobacteraceae bacterium]|nr:permease [Campylobacteraceae bacterium]
MSQEILSQLYAAGNFFIFGFLELSILFLGVSFLVEILNVFMNPTKVQKVLSSSKGGYLIASALGSITPFCSCSTIPLTLGLLKARAAFGPIMTFLFTSPLLNPIVVIVFWSAFGYQVTIVYALIAFCISMLAGFTLEKLGFERFIKKEIFQDDVKEKKSFFIKINKNTSINSSCCDSSTKPKFSFTTANSNTSTCCSKAPIEEESKKSKWEKITNKDLMKKTWKQFLSFAPYIAIGIAIGAFVHGFVPNELLSLYAGKDNPFAIPFSALIGIPLYIRASSMVGLAPALLDGGVSMGAILALTVAGAGASLPEMIMLKKIFKLPIMIFFLVSVFTMAIACGYLVNLYFS